MSPQESGQRHVGNSPGSLWKCSAMFPSVLGGQMFLPETGEHVLGQ